MPAAILGISTANGDWHGFGALGWWIETSGPTGGAPASGPRTYNASLPPAVTSITLDTATIGVVNTMVLTGDARIALPSGGRSDWVANGGASALRLAVASTGSYRAMIRLNTFDARVCAFKVYKSDGSTLLASIVVTVPNALWLAWEADEPVVLSLDGTAIRYQAILLDEPRSSLGEADGLTIA